MIAVVLIIAVNKESPATGYGIDDLLPFLTWQSRTAPTSSQPTFTLDECIADIIRSVNDDGSLSDVVIDSFFDSIQPQRIPVFSLIGFCCKKKPKT